LINAEQRRLRAPWRLAIMVALLTWLGKGMAALNAWIGWGPAPAVSILLPIAIAMCVGARLLERRPLADFGLRLNRRWFQDLGFGAMLGFGLVALIFVIEWAAGWVEIVDVFVTASPDEGFARAFLGPLAVFIAAGVGEEMLFRGFMVNNLAQGLNFPWIGPRRALVAALALASLFFAYLHYDNPNASLQGALIVTVAGLLIGLAYVLTGSLAIPIGFHIAWNLAEGAVFGYPVSGFRFTQAVVLRTVQTGPEVWTGGAFGPEAGLLGLIVILVGVAAILIWLMGMDGHLRLAVELALPPGGAPPPTPPEDADDDPLAPITPAYWQHR
jgi:hypothetical protein